jgi:flagellar basal body-associated protein FliL
LDKSKVMMIVIIVLLTAVLGGIGTLGWFITHLPNSTNNPNGSNSGSNSKEEETYNIDKVYVLDIEGPIATNLLTDTDGVKHSIRFVASIGIDMNKKKGISKESTELISLLTLQEAVVKDIIVGATRSKTYNDINKRNGKEMFAEDIKKALREKYGTNLIVSFYTSELILN